MDRRPVRWKLYFLHIWLWRLWRFKMHIRQLGMPLYLCGPGRLSSGSQPRTVYIRKKYFQRKCWRILA